MSLASPARAAATACGIAAGSWNPADEAREATNVLIAVNRGLLMRSYRVTSHSSAVLLGPGDVASCRVSEDAYLPQAYEWRALTVASVTLVDLDLATSSRARAELSQRLVDTLDDQLRRACELVAIGHLPRVEDRVLAVMLHIAERHGRVATDGIIVPIRLTHEALGQLIGARRPTVSLALRRLAEDRMMWTGVDGHRRLSHSSPEALGDCAKPSGEAARRTPQPPAVTTVA